MIIKSPTGKVWGELTGDGIIYRTHRRYTKHLVKKYRAWGIQYDLFNQLKENGVLFIEVIDLDNEKIYKSRLSDWEKYGVISVLTPEDGKQIFLSLSQFSIIDSKQTRLSV